MGQVIATIPVGIKGNQGQLRSEMANIQSTLTQNPLKINVGSTGTFNVGDAADFFNQINAGANNVEKLVVTVKEFKDTAGNTFLVPTQAIETMKDGIAGTVQTIKPLNEAFIELKKASEGWEATGKVQKGTLDIGAAARQTEVHIAAMKKSIDGTVQSASTFIEKSKNMSGRQVEDARKAAQAILEEKKAFDAAFAAQQWGKVEASGQKIRQLSGDFTTLKGATAAGANVFQSWGERMGNAIKQTISYGLSIQLVYKAQQLFNDAVKYAIDLNKEMTNIQVLQVEGAQTPEQIKALAQSFNKLGQEMGASTLEIAKGSVEWLRQGRTVAETETLLRASLMLGKLGAMEAADATNYLTSITNAFKISVMDATSVVDKLIAVDNISATSAGELATAMRYTSESAALAGVSMEQLVSYIATVSTVTRQNAEMIGQAFKTMFARMTLMQGGGLDEAGVAISKVEKSLHAVNIEIRNSDDTFKNMGDILETVSAKWDTLTTRQKTEIAVAIGGVRQKEMFLVLMNNMSKALVYQAAETTTAGLAQERYGIYLESVEAKQGRITAQMQELFTKTINSNAIRSVLDLASAFLTLVNDIGGLEPILIVITALFLALKTKAIASLITTLPELIIGLAGTTAAQLGLSAATLTLSGAFDVLMASIGPIGWIILGISAAIAALGITIGINNKKMADHQKALDDAAKSVQNYIDKVNAIPGAIKGAEDSVKRINELLSKESKVGINADELAELNSLFADLKKILPDLPWKYADGSPYLEKSVLETLDLKKAITEQAYATDEEAQAFLTSIDEKVNKYKELDDAINSNKKRIDILNEAQAALSNNFNTFGSWLDDFWNTHDIKNYTEQEKLAIDELIRQLKMGWDNMGTPEELAATIGKNLTDAYALAANNPKIQAEIEDSAALLISVAYSTKDPRLIAAVEKMYADAYGDPGFQKYLEDLIKEAQGRAWGKAAGAIAGTMAPGTMPAPETNEEKLARQNKEYQQELDLINKLSPSITKLNTALAKEGDNTVDVNTAVTEMNTKLQELADTSGLDFTVKSFDELADASGKALDPEKVAIYRDQLIQWLRDNANLIVSNPLMFNMVSDLLDTLDGKINETSVTLTDTLGNAFTMTAQQADQATQWLAQSVYNMGQDANGNLQLTLDTGQIITVRSSADILDAMAKGYMNWTTLMDNATSYALQKGIDLASNLTALLAGFASGMPFYPSAPLGGGGGGGGGGGETPEQKAAKERIKAIDDEIKDWNKKKDAINKTLDAFKDYIAAQKESLQRAKEEADFQDELTKKHKDLGKIKAEIAMLGLDNSEEAQAKRLELEDKAAGMEEDITKTTEDRKYDLQVQALDDLQKAFEDSTKKQLDAIDSIIDKLNEEKDTLQDVASGTGGGGGGGGSFTGLAATAKITSEQIIAGVEAIKKAYEAAKIEVGFTDDAIKAMLESNIEKFHDLYTAIMETKNEMERLKTESNNARIAIEQAIAAGDVHNTGTYTPVPQGPDPDHMAPPPPSGGGHQGGLGYELHHRGEFAGNLMTNEVFAKLLKGEYVATEGQMDNFLKNVLPRIAIGLSPAIVKSQISQNSVRDIKFDMKIIVAGSLDKSVLPELEDKMLKVLNKTLELRGIRRTANSFSI